LVVTNDIHYTEREHYMAREIMIARERGETIAQREENGDILPPELYVKSEDEMISLFKYVPDAITKHIKNSRYVRRHRFRGKTMALS
jgi:hypothetical protein